MKRQRLMLASLGLLALAGLTGCQSGSVGRSFGRAKFLPNPMGLKNEFGRLNVGAGDALGAAVFGQEVTLAKAEQFGDSQYAAFIEANDLND
ncbi:MAG: hypothetical protein IT439_01700 [Phycisphaerales bacterium]|nr:hypothetical protein [Phycisphaerales bacterium]